MKKSEEKSIEITDEQLKEWEEAYYQGDSKRINEACRDLPQAYREQQKIISELVEELESKTATAEDWSQRGVGTKHDFEKRLLAHEKLSAAAKEALQHLDFSEQREDIQKLLREALG
jgi:hypothetical protein